jgi:peptidoglycan/LPS O-acetylase OafA/YrhL
MNTITKPEYYPHIDGLRAIAVLIVVLFHYKISGFEGGYIGVDIFFVISGFLITGILERQINENRFSLWEFFKKRFYRIYPAVLFITAITIIAALFLFSPKHLGNLGQSALGVLSFTSNIMYWKSIGYFQILDSYDPFVPTWSLSIEIQYYLLFPVLYWIGYKLFGSRTRILVIFGAALSLLLAEIMIKYSNNFVYYNLPFRFFEFGLGSMCCYVLQTRVLRNHIRVVLASIGTTLILMSLLVLDNQTPFPGLYALLPCLGAAFIILSKGGSLSWRLYTLAPVRYLGQVSYALYLVHWPVYVMFAYWIYADITVVMKIGLLLTSLALSAFVHHVIENSYRFNAPSLLKRGILFGSTVLVLAVAGAIVMTNGLPQRLTLAQQALSEQIQAETEEFRAQFDIKFPAAGDKTFDPKTHNGLECSYNNSNDSALITTCLRHHLGKFGGFLMIGDSNGSDVYQALKRAYPNVNVAMLQQAGCAAGQYISDKRSGSWCFKDLPQIIEALFAEGKLHGIILASRWVLQPYDSVATSFEEKIPVLVIGPTPMLRHDTFETVLMLGADQPSNVQILPLQYPYFEKEISTIEGFFKNTPNMKYVSKSDLLCPESQCSVFIQNTQADTISPLFLDDQHLSSAGVSHLTEGLKENRVLFNFLKR